LIFGQQHTNANQSNQSKFSEGLYRGWNVGQIFFSYNIALLALFLFDEPKKAIIDSFSCQNIENPVNNSF